MMNLEKIVDSKKSAAHAWSKAKASAKKAAVTATTAAVLLGAYALPADAQHRRGVGHVGQPSAAHVQQLTDDQNPRGENSEFLGDLVENYRGEVFRKEGDSWNPADHPGRTHNWKWGWRLQIADMGCGNYRMQLINEWDPECPTGPNPPRRLNKMLYMNSTCEPEAKAYRMSEKTALVENATDDDFMKIYNVPSGLEIDNLVADSFVGVPGASREELADRKYVVESAEQLGLDPSKQELVRVDQYQMDQLMKYVQGANDPYTITVFAQGSDAQGNPRCDVISVTNYAVDFDGPAAEGVPSRIYKTSSADLYLDENRMVREYIDTSVHGDPEIFAGEPALDSRDNVGFAWGITNKYKVTKDINETYAPFEELNRLWERINVYDPGNALYRGDNK